MIKTIYGAKGSGKTKQIIAAANDAVDNNDGNVVFVTDNDNALEIRPEIRFVNVREYNVKGKEQFLGFLKGILAANFDINSINVDGLVRITGVPCEDLEDLFEELEKLREVDFNVTVTTGDKVPSFIKKRGKKA